ncbi:MAG: MBL fold metallo-hydrolase [Arthrobacter sp.]
MMHQQPTLRFLGATGGGMDMTFLPAGHILGAAPVHVRTGPCSVHFAGDLGRTDDPPMNPPRPLEGTDFMVTESTHGNRLCSSVDPEQQLGDIVRRVAKRGGVVLFAAFAVGRAETLMLHLSPLRGKNLILDIPVVPSGYQAGGTRDAALAGGARELRIYGEDVTIRAEVVQMESLSAHADADGILAWLKNAPREPRMTYITHGEPDASDALRLRIKRELGGRTRVPEHLEKISLEDPR